MMKFLIVLILALFALSSVNASSAIECELCEYAANYGELLIQSNATETEIIDKVENFCKVIPSSFQATCDSLIANYGKQLIQMIVNKESPSTLCAQIDMCASSTEAVQGILECDICQFIVKQVNKYISGNATEAQILKFLDTDCEVFGKGGSVTCQNIVNNYAPQIINLIINNASPSQVCGLVGLCGSSLKIEEPVQGELECGVCEVIAQQCSNYIKANKTESEIVGLLDQFCSTLSIFESACDTIVASSAPKIINLLLQNQSATVVCTEIGFCGNSSSGNNNHSSSEESSSSSQPSSSSESSESSYSGSMTGASSGSASGSGSGTSGNMKIYIK
ncbi:saposin B domain-containing protein [Dictyostelium discoideum AX4]|uniref:Saposin B domain-containing protein n=1 Tax=Dictyostelium discoideum TaxID=44689 RepID=Q54LG3_DICDI|nr:saposin B domain-containing protein [Dictyostelium discoideum AX4]EAL64081.2 saposin B domain-containing protein [Dictyostelium discoideum AX4]|eukprot:XP_637598.2 saposin B domain-containing protein [Dictyostelium discoideum AX4]